MKKIIYHGSKDIIQQPVYGYGKTYNDYGLGFYCTESQELAKEWSVSLDRDGYSNRYEIDCDGLSVIHLGSEEYCMMHWLSVLLENREFDMPSSLAAESAFVEDWELLHGMELLQCGIFRYAIVSFPFSFCFT